ncbi:C-type lectin galactose-binding isoform [Chionoecetes opilio]|uniref:C-type lectin galactose-binding isoform n=1 Tax=Chionoecetes opilio TaxID=41210 RepID=A0A8J5CVK3_CHIOP|nr:C-type lectin galactose-binding isoform [Chionoecetes opilio]
MPEEGNVRGMTRRVTLLEATEMSMSRLAARVEALEGNGAAERLDTVDRRVAALEEEAAMVILLNSRLRDVQAEQHLLREDLASVRRTVRRCNREVKSVKREVMQPEALAGKKVNPACCLSLKESILEAEEREHEVNATLYDLGRQLHNLSNDLHDLQQQTRHQPLRKTENVEQRGGLGVGMRGERRVPGRVKGVGVKVVMVVMKSGDGDDEVLCPTPYTKVGGWCFYVLARRWTWDEARTACSKQGAAVGGHGDLATPSDLTTFRVYIEGQQTDSPYLWVGGERVAGRWRWVSGSRGEDDLHDLLALPWDLGEPDNTPDQRHLCVHSSGNIKFHDCKFTAKLPAVCQVT